MKTMEAHISAPEDLLVFKADSKGKLLEISEFPTLKEKVSGRIRLYTPNKAIYKTINGNIGEIDLSTSKSTITRLDYKIYDVGSMLSL